MNNDPVKRHRGEQAPPSLHLCCAGTQPEADLPRWLWWLTENSTAPNKAYPKSCSCAGLTRDPLFSFSSTFPIAKLIYCHSHHISPLAMSKQDTVLLLSHWNSYMDGALASEGRRTEEVLLHHTLLVLFSNPLLSAASLHSCSFAEIPATLCSKTLHHLPIKWPK